MDVPEIIYEVFKHIPLKNYKTCSQVCVLWYCILRPRYREVLEKHCDVLRTVIQLYPDGVYPDGIRGPGWDYDTLSTNPLITWNFVLEHMADPAYSHLPEQAKWDFRKLSANPAITWDIVEKNMELKWDFRNLSANPNITWEIVEQNPNIRWNYYELMKNPNISWETILSNQNKFRINYGITLNPHIPQEYRDHHPEIEWALWEMRYLPGIPHHLRGKIGAGWSYFCQHNPHITWELICENSDESWDFRSLSKNPHAMKTITWSMIKLCSGFPIWDYNAVLHHKNILIDIIMESLATEELF